MQKTDFRTLQKEENGEEDNDAYTHDTPKKRRTVDKEGFVTPTTPDIPKSSPYYQCDDRNSLLTTPDIAEGSGELFGDNFLTLYPTFLPSETSEDLSNSEVQNEENYESNTETQFNQPSKDSLNIGSMSSQSAEMTTPSTEATGDSSEREDSEGSPQSIYDDLSIADLIKDMSEKSMKVYMHWMELFRDGEKFEEGVPSLIDELLNQAKRIEEDLIEQKEALRQRIYRITQTLRVDDL
eukprot:XP_011434749.1 PREDICTED: HEAT repeat-containing protein 1 homolog [Crassostrea gigas]